MNITSKQHVQVLAAAQKNVDNSVSKTCNGAKDDTVESVDELYRMAKDLGCKCVSYYRDGSREGQVLDFDESRRKENEEAISHDRRPIGHNQGICRRGKTESEPEHIERPRELQGSTWRIPFDGRKSVCDGQSQRRKSSRSFCHRIRFPKVSVCLLRKCCAADLTPKKSPAV